MTGYHADPGHTAAALDEDGWFHTGDCATIDGDGFVSMRGRKKDVFKTTTGKYVAPPHAIAERFRVLCPGGGDRRGRRAALALRGSGLPPVTAAPRCRPPSKGSTAN